MAVHPSRFVWDFWYYYDEKERIFHVMYLNADYSLVPDERHHFSSMVGYARTKDFENIDWIKDDAFTADEKGWDNTSIWTGDVIKTKDGYLLFYTSRNRKTDDGFTQNVGMALSDDFINWKRLPDVRIIPDKRWYETKSIKEEDTIHAWRDPYLFIEDGQTFMLLSAKSIKSPINQKGAVAILKAKDNSLTEWEALPPILSPSCYGEMEVPMIFKDEKGQKHITFSVNSKYDFCTETDGKGGLLATEISSAKPETSVILPYSSGIYAARIIPELGGETVGFDIEKGSFKKGVTKSEFRLLNRDFASFSALF